MSFKQHNLYTHRCCGIGKNIERIEEVFLRLFSLVVNDLNER